MALNFPNSPVDGQVYPDPPIPGVQQYIWNAAKGTWLTVFQGITDISAEAPIYLTGPEGEPVVAISPATIEEAGSLSASDKAKLDSIPPEVGSLNAITAGVGLGAPASGDTIRTEGTINLLPASTSGLGGVKQGVGVTIAEDGLLSVAPPTQVGLGGVRQGNGVSIAPDGVLSIAQGGTFKVLDPLSFDGVAVNFQLRVGGNPFVPATINSLLIFIGGVLQIPNISYSMSSSGVVTFTEAPAFGLFFYGISLT